MAFKKGEIANPTGYQREKKFQSALDRAIAQDDGKKLKAAAGKLLALAAAGEPWAIKELADRVDGKSVQTTNLNVNDRRADELTDSELLRIAAAGSARTAEPADGPQVPSKLH